MVDTDTQLITVVDVLPGNAPDHLGTTHPLRAFRFEAAVCQACPLRSQCIAAKGREGRQVLIHPQEALLQEVRTLRQTADYDECRRRPYTGWPDWGSWEPARPGTSVVPRPNSGITGCSRGQLDPVWWTKSA